MNKFIQYELWKDCKNNCSFCFNRCQPDIDKISSLNFTIKKLLSQETDEYSEIGFIGGEFFQDQLNCLDVKNLFYELFRICKRKYDEGKLKKIYLTTSLLYSPNNLMEFLKFSRSLGLSSCILLCTSYDLKYRFHNDVSEKLWRNNVKLVHSEFPEVNIHVETIVTQFFIDAVLSKNFSIKRFSEENNVTIDYIEPASGFFYKDKKEMAKVLPDFFPTKKSFIEFLKQEAIKKYNIFLYKFLSMNVRSNTVYCYLDKKLLRLSDRRVTGAGFQEVVKGSKIKYESGFIDSDDKMIDIVKALAVQTSQGDI